jgi:hypothetical protein
MSIRLRTVNGVRVAVCAARSVEKPGDLYLDDADHHALAEKFTRDFGSEGRLSLVPGTETEGDRIAEAEESNNPAREWWDRTYLSRSPAPAAVPIEQTPEWKALVEAVEWCRSGELSVKQHENCDMHLANRARALVAARKE